MSANRRRVYGTDESLSNEISFDRFLKLCRSEPIIRVQGRSAPGRRFNRAVLVLTDTATETSVEVERVRWDRQRGVFELTGQRMRVEWRSLDWVSWTATGDPNGTWLKVTTVR